MYRLNGSKGKPMNMKLILRIRRITDRDAMSDILKQLPLDLNKTEDAFSKDLAAVNVKQYELFWIRFSSPVKITRAVPKMRTLPK